MTNGPAYYNEFDPAAAEWLRQLIRDGLITDGVVDERSIADVQPDDLRGFRRCHFFAGIGLWDHALNLAGWGADEVWTGSCPCQPFSSAGKQLGQADERHLWPEFMRLIAACRPRIVFGEQVASAPVVGGSGRNPARHDGPVWLDGVFADLEAAYYACWATDLPAASVGAPHIRQRLWWCAYDLGVADTAGRGFGVDRGTPRGAGHVDERDKAGWLANPDGGQSGHGELQPSRQHGQQPQDGGAGGLADAKGQRENPEPGSGSQGIPDGDRRRADGRMADATGELGERGQHFEVGRAEGRAADWRLGPWSDFALVYCTDGKLRRIPAGSESVVQRVVNGDSAGVDSLGDEGRRVAQAAQGYPLTAKIPHRAPLLRGVGNAIVPDVTAVFIEASRRVVRLIPQ